MLDETTEEHGLWAFFRLNITHTIPPLVVLLEVYLVDHELHRKRKRDIIFTTFWVTSFFQVWMIVLKNLSGLFSYPVMESLLVLFFWGGSHFLLFQLINIPQPHTPNNLLSIHLLTRKP